jgi:hypothetical protein
MDAEKKQGVLEWGTAFHGWCQYESDSTTIDTLTTEKQKGGRKYTKPAEDEDNRSEVELLKMGNVGDGKWEMDKWILKRKAHGI